MLLPKFAFGEKKFFNQTPKTTLYPELKVQLCVHNFLTTHFGLKSGQLLTSLPTFLPIGQKDGVGGNTHVNTCHRPHPEAISV